MKGDLVSGKGEGAGDKPGSDGLESWDYRRPSGSKIIYTVGRYAEEDNGADADRVKYQQPGFRVPALH